MRRAARWLVPVLGAVLCAAGVAAYAAAEATSQDDLGRFAYAPADLDVAYDSQLLLSFDDPWPLLWTGGHLLGAGLLVVGLLVLAGWAGGLLGRRSGARGGPGALVVPGVVAGLLLVGGAVLVLVGHAPAEVVYGGSYAPLSCPDPGGCSPGSAPLRVEAAQLAGLGTAVLGGVVATAAAGWWSAGRRRVAGGPAATP